MRLLHFAPTFDNGVAVGDVVLSCRRPGLDHQLRQCVAGTGEAAINVCLVTSRRDSLQRVGVIAIESTKAQEGVEAVKGGVTELWKGGGRKCLLVTSRVGT